MGFSASILCNSHHHKLIKTPSPRKLIHYILSRNIVCFQRKHKVEDFLFFFRIRRMHRGLPRLRASGSLILNRLRVPHLRKKASNSLTAAQDTFYSIKDTFERHKIVFTISTSIASVATAWAGYSLRQLHQSRVEQRLESIEKAMKNNYQMEDPELRKLVSGTVSLPACVATAGTTLIIGYGLGWRSGAWFANRKMRREQMKLLEQIKPRRWPLKFLRRPLMRSKPQENAAKISQPLPNDGSMTQS